MKWSITSKAIDKTRRNVKRWLPNKAIYSDMCYVKSILQLNVKKNQYKQRDVKKTNE